MSWSSRHRTTLVRYKMSTTPSSICIWPAKTNRIALIYMLVSSKVSWRHTKHFKITSTISILEMWMSLSKLSMILVQTSSAKSLWTTFWTSFQEIWRAITATYFSTCMRVLLTFNNLSTRDGEIRWLEFQHTQLMLHWLRSQFILVSKLCQILMSIPLGLISKATISGSYRVLSIELSISTKLPKRMPFGMPKETSICLSLTTLLLRLWIKNWLLICRMTILTKLSLLTVGWSMSITQQQVPQATLGDAITALSHTTTRFLTQSL